MKIRIKEAVDTTETSVEILCKRVNEDILQLERHIQLFSKTLLAKENGEYIQVPAGDIYYIESIDRKTFVYTKDTTLQINLRLYELEDRLEDSPFMRVSKSMIINLQKISILTPELNRMLLATMDNGEKIYISRQYAAKLKALLLNEAGNRGAKS